MVVSLDYARSAKRTIGISPGVWLFLATAILGSAMSLWMRVPSLFCAMGMIEGLAVAFVDVTLLRPLLQGGRLLTARVLLLLAAAVLVPVLQRPTPNSCFKLAFGQAPPAGLKELSLDVVYSGGPSDLMVFLKFNADQQTIDSLLTPRGFVSGGAAERFSERKSAGGSSSRAYFQ